MPDAHVPAASPFERWPVAVHGVRALAASPDGRLVALGLASGSIELRDLHTGALIVSFDGDRVAVSALTFAAGGHLVAAWDDGRVATIAVQPT